MTIRKKTLLVTGLTVIALAGASWYIAEFFLRRQLAGLYLQCAQRDVERVRNALASEFDGLDADNRDWAGWDATYAFIADKNEAYARENLVDSSFTTLSLNLLAFVDKDRQLVWGGAFDLREKKSLPLPAAMAKLIALPESPVLCTNEQRAVCGLVRLDGQLTLLSARPILTSHNKGPLRGTLIMARYFDEPVGSRLGKVTGLSIAVTTPDPPRGQKSGYEAWAAMPGDPDAACLDCPQSTECRSRLILRDLRGRPSVMLELSHPYSAAQAGHDAAARSGLALLLSALGIGAVGFVVQDRLLLRRLSRLSGSARRIGSAADMASRLPCEGRDEVSSLAREINRLLDRLQAAQRELQALNEELEQRVTERTRALKEETEQRGKSEARYRALVEAQDDMICRWQPDTTLTYVNAALGEFFGRPPPALVGRRWLTMLEANRQEEARRLLESGAAEPRRVELEFACPSAAGGVRCIHWRSSPIRGTDGRVVEWQTVARDVTDERRITADLRESREEIRRLHRHRDRVQEMHQRLVAERLHDEVGQNLTVLKMDLQWMTQQLSQPSEEQRRRLREIEKSIEVLTEVTQEVAMDLRPSVLDHFGLPAAIEWLAKRLGDRGGYACELDLDESVLPDSDASIGLFRIAQELLTNVARHAGAQRVRVRLGHADGKIRLTVEDDGRGIRDEEKRSPAAFGLTAVRERAKGLGGDVEIAGRRDAGTTVVVEIPWSPAAGGSALATKEGEADVRSPRG